MNGDDQSAPDHPGAQPRSGFSALLWAINLCDGLTSSGKLVLIILAKHADKKGICYPSMERIAAFTCLSERTCQKAICDLEAEGFITVDRNTGRGNCSIYKLDLSRSNDIVKGEATAPFVGSEKVQPLHPLPAERVKSLQIKGAAAAPQLTIELPKQAATKKRTSKQVTPTLKAPRRSDPREAWYHLADRHPDGGPKIDTSPIGDPDRGRPIVEGVHLDVAADLVCQAAKIANPNCTRDWGTIVAWLKDGFDLHEHILKAICDVAARASYKPEAVVRLKYFDAKVRGIPSGGSSRR